MRHLICPVLMLAASCYGAGRLELFSAPRGLPEELIQGSWQIGTVPTTDKLAATLRIRNTGDAAVVLTTLRIAGTGFSLTGAQSLPYTVAAGTNVDFTLEFRPPDYGSYSGNLLVNSTGYVIRGAGSAALGLFRDGVGLSSGDVVDFGRVQVGEEKSVSFQLRNTTAEPNGVSKATVSGPAFIFPNGTPTPYLLPGQSVNFSVRFRPASASVFQEKLVIDNRTFWLTGTGYDPPLPRPALVVETPVLRSGEQGKISIRLAQKAMSRASGRIRMELRPDGKISDNDGAACFLNGSRVYDFQITENDVAVSFGGQPALTFQAGTTTGTIVFTVEAGGFTDQAVVGIGAAPVQIEKASAVRRTGALDVQITGFDNTRTVSDMSFTFYSAAGQPLAGMPVRVPVARDFERWWQDSKLGGIFSFRASFPVAGDSSQIGSVEVEIVNSSGTSRTQRLIF